MTKRKGPEKGIAAGHPPPAVSYQLNFLLAVYTLSLREMVRFYRQPSRVVGALGTALLFWAILGTGIGGSDYRAYFFPGTIVMSVMFTCIFSTASIIEDRHAGFLQSVLVAPIPRSAIVLGKILGGSLLATLQGLIILLFAGTVGATFQTGPFLGMVLSLFLLAFVITAMGFWLAWKIESSAGFHTLMNMILLPMWMASGAVFPGGSTSWMRILTLVDPFTYGVAGIRRGLFPDSDLSHIPDLPTCLEVLAVFGLVFYLFSSFVVWKSRERK